MASKGNANKKAGDGVDPKVKADFEKFGSDTDKAFKDFGKAMDKGFKKTDEEMKKSQAENKNNANKGNQPSQSKPAAQPAKGKNDGIDPKVKADFEKFGSDTDKAFKDFGKAMGAGLKTTDTEMKNSKKK